LEFLGRIDAQVKIRGMRVELGEIEEVLARQPGISAAAVSTSHSRLVAYLVTDGETDRLDAFDLVSLRRDLAVQLPEHMIPQAFAGLAQLPLTPSGKLDRKALPEVEVEIARVEYAAPQDATETLVANTMAELLDLERVGRNDDFFALGGHSLMAVRLASRLEAETGTSLPVTAIFQSASVVALAQLLKGGPDGAIPTDIGVDEATADLALADALPPREGVKAKKITEAERILLTGATGFFGRYLVRDLLSRTTAQVLCLVRGSDEQAALGRIHSALRAIPQISLPKGWESRIEVVCGDLGEDKLGLSDDRWNALEDSVDAILHNAAEVNVVKPYEMLKQANTLSVLHMLELMSKGRPKSLVFVSTLGTVENPFPSDRQIRNPEHEPAPQDSGYNLSKWAAEQLILRARAKGYDAQIMRPGLIIGDAETGYYDTADAGYSYASLFLDTGALPDGMWVMPRPWINVDRAAQRMLDLATLDSLPFGTAHIFEYGAAPPEFLKEAMPELEIIPSLDWLCRAIELLENTPDHVAIWLLPNLLDMAANASEHAITPPDVETVLDVLSPPDLPCDCAQLSTVEPKALLAPTLLWVAEDRSHKATNLKTEKELTDG